MEVFSPGAVVPNKLPGAGAGAIRQKIPPNVEEQKINGLDDEFHDIFFKSNVKKYSRNRPNGLSPVAGPPNSVPPDATFAF
jgi:hypothetical protein